MKAQIIKQEIDSNNNGCNIEDLLWESEKHWQAQLITIFYVMNIVNDLHCRKEKAIEST